MCQIASNVPLLAVDQSSIFEDGIRPARLVVLEQQRDMCSPVVHKPHRHSVLCTTVSCTATHPKRMEMKRTFLVVRVVTAGRLSIALPGCAAGRSGASDQALPVGQLPSEMCSVSLPCSSSH